MLQKDCKKGMIVMLESGHGEYIEGYPKDEWAKEIEEGNPFKVDRVLGYDDEHESGKENYDNCSVLLVGTRGKGTYVYAHPCRITLVKGKASKKASTDPLPKTKAHKTTKVQVGDLVTFNDESWAAVVGTDGKVFNPCEGGGYLNNRKPWKVVAINKEDSGFPSYDSWDELKYENGVMLIHPETKEVAFNTIRSLKPMEEEKVTVKLDVSQLRDSKEKWDEVVKAIDEATVAIGRHCCYCDIYDAREDGDERGYRSGESCPLLESCGYCQGNGLESNYKQCSNALCKASQKAESIQDAIVRHIQTKGGKCDC